jgi:hypothetical protein
MNCIAVANATLIHNGFMPICERGNATPVRVVTMRVSNKKLDTMYHFGYVNPSKYLWIGKLRFTIPNDTT